MAGAGTATVDNLDPALRTAALGLAGESGGRVWIESGWRSNASQTALYIKNCGSLSAPMSACHPATAKPGTSQHEAGRAVDFGGDMALTASLAPKYGLVRTVPGEAWHYELAGNRPATPADVKNLSGGTGILGNPLDGLSAIKDALTALMDGHLWLRVAMVAGGGLAVVIGLALLGVDIRKGLSAAPGAGEIRQAAAA